MTMRLPQLYALCLLLLLPGLAWPQGTRAFLDREEIVLGESVTLNIETDRSGGGEPDLSALGADVRVLGSSTSTELSLVNGQQSARTLWGIVLQPLSEGIISIPALEVRGERTEPLRLSVLPVAARAVDASADLLLEVEAAPESPYVQQQVIYTVRLLYAVTLLDGQLDEPRANGAELRRLGGDATYSRDVGGRRYNVIERRYALTPLASGPLTVEAPRFRGRALAGGRANRMFDPGTPVSAAGEAVTLEVKPRPTSAGEPWLPAQSVDYRAQTGAAGTLKMGEPITLSLRLAASGLSAEQLPELRLPEIAGAEVYPDQESSVTREGTRGIQGERSRSFALVPTRPGTLELPRLTLRWWDVIEDRPREAVIEPQRFEVAADPVATAPPAASETRGETGQASASARSVVEGVHPFWRIVGLLQLPLLIGFAVAWWRARSKPMASMPSPPPLPSSPPPSLSVALREGELGAIADALRTQARWRGLGPDLGALQSSLDEPEQRAAIALLQRALYADGDASKAVQALRTAFAQGPVFVGQAGAAAAQSELPPLYPPRGDGR